MHSGPWRDHKVLQHPLRRSEPPYLPRLSPVSFYATRPRRPCGGPDRRFFVPEFLGADPALTRSPRTNPELRALAGRRAPGASGARLVQDQLLMSDDQVFSISLTTESGIGM